MEKLLFPCFITTVFSTHLKKYIVVPMIVQKHLPMDYYNALSNAGSFEDVDTEYSWITNKGRILSQEEAAEFAYEHHLLDKKVKKLRLEDYKGSWKA